jgi:hypothetical protein
MHLLGVYFQCVTGQRKPVNMDELILHLHTIVYRFLKCLLAAISRLVLLLQTMSDHHYSPLHAYEHPIDRVMSVIKGSVTANAIRWLAIMFLIVQGVFTQIHAHIAICS